MKPETQIQSDVLAELEWEPSVRAEDIGVTVHHGVVTLTGEVDGYPEKIAAEHAAQRVGGVKAVANELKVTLPGEHQRNDTDIAEAAVGALAWSYNVPKDGIRVSVRNGWITLEGSVDWQYQRDAAYRAVSNLKGVVGVSNSILVKPRVTPQQIKGKIESALTRSAVADAARVTVVTEGGKVMLRGNVRSQAERTDVERAAWSAPGVTSLESFIEVEPQELALLM